MAARDDIEEIARIAIDCGFVLHRDIGPGLLESVYEILMFESLRQRGPNAARQVPIRIEYNGIVIDNAFKADLLIEGRKVFIAWPTITIDSHQERDPFVSSCETSFLDR